MSRTDPTRSLSRMRERFLFGVSEGVGKSVVYFPMCLQHLVPLAFGTSVLGANPKLPFLGALQDFRLSVLPW